MVAFWIILAIIGAAFLSVALFVYGPYIIEAAVEKIDEWAEIIDAFKEEK